MAAIRAAYAPPVRHDDRGHDGGHFAHQGKPDQIGDVNIGREFTKLHRAYEGEDGADQEIDHTDDHQRRRTGIANIGQKIDRPHACAAAQCQDTAAGGGRQHGADHTDLGQQTDGLAAKPVQRAETATGLRSGLCQPIGQQPQ
jgi:hypothetical protein